MRTSGDADRDRADRAMDRYADGDEAAFGELYDALAPRLLGFAARLPARGASAEDVVQQTFLTLHRARDRWIRGARVFPWAYAIAHHVAVDWARRLRLEVAPAAAAPAAEPPAPPPRADEALDARRRLAALLRELEGLPERHRLAFQLVALEGLSIPEAAEVLGITRGNVKVQVHRAREALRRLAPDAAGEEAEGAAPDAAAPAPPRGA